MRAGPGDGREQVSGEQSNARPPQKVHVYVIIFFLWPLLVSFQPPAEENVVEVRSPPQRRRLGGDSGNAVDEAMVEQGLECSLQPSPWGSLVFQDTPARELVCPALRRGPALLFCEGRGRPQGNFADVGMVISLITAMDCDPSYSPRNLLLTMQARGMQLLWRRNGHLPAPLHRRSSAASLDHIARKARRVAGARRVS
jgi:hypothetical protein